MSNFVLRPNTSDEIIRQYIWEHNEYRIPETLQPTDVIIDIGAHIGSFSHLCWQRGARKIFAFEPFPENFELCQSNLAATSVTLANKAVWTLDPSPLSPLFLTGFSPMLLDGPDPITPGDMNTGTPSVFGSAGKAVETIALDDIIGDQSVRILKVDCEGSEFPILLTAKRLKQVQYITGEYHLMEKWPAAALMDGYTEYTLGDLADCLTSLRFRVEFVPFKDPSFAARVGNFFAYNLDWSED
ncbi:FkbM family methyltransferase [Acaryochloris thomasi]|nr:FkbM family methyltransferase [Acaryochloris thomasi]